MAVTSTIEYTTHRYIKDIYPGIDSFDTKARIYNWTQESALDDYGGTSNLNIWYSYDTGLITQLFLDGNKATKLSLSSASTLSGAVADGVFTWTVTSEAKFGQYDIIKCDNQYGMISGSPGGAGLVMTNVTNASLFNTQSVAHDSGATVYIAVDESAYDSGDTYFFVYDPDLDLCIFSMPSDLSPNDAIIESGEDASTLMTRMIRRSSRMVESLLDSRLSREIMKDREGNYPEFIQRATGLKAITMLLKSQDPENPVIESFEEEFNEIIEGYRSGMIQLPNAITSESSKGIIREVSVNSSSDLRPVELHGNYTTSGYDLIKIKIITGGVIGTATYSVWVKDSDKLKNHQAMTAEKITGDYDPIASGLRIRFQGDDDSAIVTADDEWEIDVHSSNLDTTVSHSGSIRLSRSKG